MCTPRKGALPLRHSVGRGEERQESNHTDLHSFSHTSPDHSLAAPSPRSPSSLKHPAWVCKVSPPATELGLLPKPVSIFYGGLTVSSAAWASEHGRRCQRVENVC